MPLEGEKGRTVKTEQQQKSLQKNNEKLPKKCLRNLGTGVIFCFI